jgi:hypothetical protein
MEIVARLILTIRLQLCKVRFRNYYQLIVQVSSSSLSLETFIVNPESHLRGPSPTMSQQSRTIHFATGNSKKLAEVQKFFPNTDGGAIVFEKIVLDDIPEEQGESLEEIAAAKCSWVWKNAPEELKKDPGFTVVTEDSAFGKEGALRMRLHDEFLVSEIDNSSSKID